MKKQREIGQALQGFGKQIQSFAAKVVSLDGEMCSVDDDNFELFNVRLRASVDGNDNRVMLIPKLGSWVVVSRIRSADEFYVSMVSEVDKVIMSIENKYTIKNISTSLKDILNGIITELKTAIITTPAGPGSIAPSTQVKLDLIDQKINQLLEE